MDRSGAAANTAGDVERLARADDDFAQDSAAPRAAPPARRGTIASLLVLLLLVNLSTSLYQLPLNRVIERRLCKDYFLKLVEPGSGGVFGPDGQVNEDLCKLNQVQEGLAKQQRFMDEAWIFGDLIMTIPLGLMAERYGRRVVLLLNLIPRVALMASAVIVGYFDNWIPVGALRFAPMLSVLGGDCIFNSVTYALAAGLTDDNIVRASYFGYMSSITYVVALTGPALASATMSLLIWLPFCGGIILLFFAVRFISLLPETSDPGRDSDYIDSPTSPIRKSKILDSRSHILQSVKQRVLFLASFITSRPRNFSLLLASMFLTSLGSADTKLFVQYISKRYEWSFASAGYLLSAKAVVNFVLLTIVVPAILQGRAQRRSRHLSRVSPERSNIKDANICLVFSIVGVGLIGMAYSVWILIPGLLVYALGSALPVFTLSLLKSPLVSPAPESPSSSTASLLRDDASHSSSRSSSDSADSSHDTTVFSIVMLVKTIGSLVGVPVVTSLWIRGIEAGGISLGMPYFASAGCYAVAMGVLASMRVV